MLSREIKVQNEIGLHARPATLFVQKANSFASTIWVEVESRRINGKSLLGLLSMGLVKDVTFTLIVDGTDEEEAIEALVNLVMYELGQ